MPVGWQVSSAKRFSLNLPDGQADLKEELIKSLARALVVQSQYSVAQDRHISGLVA